MIALAVMPLRFIVAATLFVVAVCLGLAGLWSHSLLMIGAAVLLVIAGGAVCAGGGPQEAPGPWPPPGYYNRRRW